MIGSTPLIICLSCFDTLDNRFTNRYNTNTISFTSANKSNHSFWQFWISSYAFPTGNYC